MKKIYDEYDITRAVQDIAESITEYIYDLKLTQPPTLMCVLDGGFRFYSDIISLINIPVKCDFIKVSSYSKKEQEDVKVHKFPKYPIIGSTIIIIDDILDSGVTINYIIENLKHHGAENIAVATLLYRINSPILPVEHFKGLKINDEWVAGYGLDDFEGTSRNLNYIYELDKK